MSDIIRVLVVDDHPLFRDGVVRTLETDPDIEIVGQGANAQEAIRLSQALLPDILLLDISIPGGGIPAAQVVAESCPVTRIIMLTASEDEDDLLAAFKAGARAYILKGVSARELLSALHSVMAGESYVTPALAASLLSEMSGASGKTHPPTSPLDELTEREHQILELVAQGSSNKEIALKLHLSEKTVKHYMTNVLQKLHVRNRVEAALLAQKQSV
jgi:two-component system, NarL family, nitrate/nitrite response regulator NarL